MLDLVEINSQEDQNFRKNYEILTNINKAKTLDHVIQCLWEPEVESLREGKRSDTTSISSSVAESRGKYGLASINMNKIIHPDPYAKLR